MTSGDQRSKLRLGFIGIGGMGSRMSRRLLAAGYDLTIYNRKRERTHLLEQIGAKIAATPRELAAGADVVLSSVADDAAVESVMFRHDGALAGARPGSIFIEMSTVSPAMSQRVYEVARGQDVSVLDAPVSGSTPQAEQGQHREFPSGPNLTAEQMVAGVKKLVGDWKYDVVAIGYPGAVLHGRPVADPHNLGPGWVGFDYQAAFGCRVKVVNDAAMQALGSYQGGKMLFLGIGTGLGSTLIVDGIVEPMELGHLPYKKSTFEDYVGIRGLQRLGKKKWRQAVNDVVARLIAALEPDDVVLGGGNVKKLKQLPPGCREGDNANAFLGGFRIWEEVTRR